MGPGEEFVLVLAKVYGGVGLVESERDEVRESETDVFEGARSLLDDVAPVDREVDAGGNVRLVEIKKKKNAEKCRTSCTTRAWWLLGS